MEYQWISFQEILVIRSFQTRKRQCDVEALCVRFIEFSKIVNIIEPLEEPKQLFEEKSQGSKEPPKSTLKLIRESKNALELKQADEEKIRAKLATEASKNLSIIEDALAKENRILSSLNYKTGFEGFLEGFQEVKENKIFSKNLLAILEIICKYPENIQYRTLLTSNPSVSTLLETKGIKQSLLSLGFRPKLIQDSKTETETVAYFLEEPSIEKDFEAWSKWFETLKQAQEYVRDSLK